MFINCIRMLIDGFAYLPNLASSVQMEGLSLLGSRYSSDIYNLFELIVTGGKVERVRHSLTSTNIHCAHNTEYYVTHCTS